MSVWTGAAFVLQDCQLLNSCDCWLAGQEWLDWTWDLAGFLDGVINSKLSARFSLDLLPGFEWLAGKFVLYGTNATAGTVSAQVKKSEPHVH